MRAFCLFGIAVQSEVVAVVVCIIWFGTMEASYYSTIVW